MASDVYFGSGGQAARLAYGRRTAPRTTIRWGWILAVALGSFLGLLLATWLGETGARIGRPDKFDLEGLAMARPPAVSSTSASPQRV